MKYIMRGLIIKKFVLFILFIFMLSNIAFALDYTVDVTSPSSVNEYEGEKISNKFSFVITNNGDYCDITCDWVTTAGQGSGIKVADSGGKSSTINFDVKADGSNGIASYSLIITCDRITGLTCWSDPDQETYEASFRYLWNGDGICTTEREKCAAYQSYLKDSACLCSSTTKCNPSSERGADNKGCATYCGNAKKESQYETCSNCPDDVGKCDGQSCNSKTECEGNYCVHNKCSHTAYIKGDTFCDSNVGENCLNSASDCACSSSQKCNSQGKCETYCGNGICESSEQGVCKSDCQWCGDGTCDPNKETCKGCPSDCGECEKTEEEEQVTQQLLKIKEEAEVSAQRTKDNKLIINITIGSTLGIIILLIIGYLIYKKIKQKKSSPKESKSKSSTTHKCPKCHSKNDPKSKFCSECGHKLK